MQKDTKRIDADAHLQFYGERCVAVHIRPMLVFGDTYYFCVPEGVFDDLKEYVAQHTIPETADDDK